jgi:hypothetical protein
MNHIFLFGMKIIFILQKRNVYCININEVNIFMANLWLNTETDFLVKLNYNLK